MRHIYQRLKLQCSGGLWSTIAILGIFQVFYANGQISGPASANTGVTTTYTYTDDVILPSANWTADNGSIQTQTRSGTTYTATVKWTCPGTGNLYFKNGTIILQSKSVTINCAAVPTPSATFSYASQCGSTTITFSGSPGLGAQWFWQDSPTGTRQDLGSGNTLTVTTSGTYYLRSLRNCCWSASSQATAPVTVSATPGLPVVTNNQRCGTGPITLTASPASGANTTRWYTASTGGTSLLEGVTYNISNLATSTDYYVSSFNTTTGCEGSARSLIRATVNAIPGLPVPTATPSQLCGTGNTVLSATGAVAGENYQWYDAAGTMPLGSTTQSISATTSWTAAIRNTTTGCEGAKASVVASVYTLPSITNTGSAILVYGSATDLVVGGTFNAYQWTKNGVDISGATAASYQVREPATYTLKARQAVGSPMCSSNSVVVQPAIQNQPAPVNHESTTRIFKAGVTGSTSLYTLQPNELMQMVNYQDGLGRTFQTVMVGQSPTSTDLVTMTSFGRQSVPDTTYLPYGTSTRDGRFRLNAIRGSNKLYTASEQYAFYQNASKVAHDQYPYAVDKYYTTPSLRRQQQGAPGAEWQTAHTTNAAVTLNITGEVRLWKADGTTNQSYTAGELTVQKITDENGAITKTYADKEGKVILKKQQLDEVINGTMVSFLETYYIYDGYGQVKYILPPKAVALLGTGTTLDANSSMIFELIYKNTYDDRGRLVEKKVPGAALQYYVYDKLDRLALTQDGNLRALGKWIFIKYDVYNRSVYVGLYANAGTRTVVQNDFNVRNYDTEPWYESEQNNATYQGYSNVVFPTSGLELISVNYYDHYDFNRDNTADFTYDASHLAGLPTSSANSVRGLMTGNRTLILGTTQWLFSAAFYDSYDRPVQQQYNNHLNTTAISKKSILYDFVGRALSSKRTHVDATTTTVIGQRSDIDHAGRILALYHSINGVEQKIATYEYNALGQLVDKKLHVSGSSFLQSIDYRYTIRGWLESINNAQLTNDANTNDETNDYFGMELLYNKADATLGNTPTYAGAISAAKWKGVGASGVTDQRSYKYIHDKAGRTKTATFQANNGTTWTKEAGTLNENVGYDHNGNILNLTRQQNDRGLSGPLVTSTPQTIDNLAYTYTAGNQVSKVEDSGTTAGFINGTVNGANEYTYSTDGSLLKDDNKGISAITYNTLGKPATITHTNGTVVAYTYDGGGNKLRMVVTKSGSTVTTDYADGLVYTNNALSFLALPEGRVVKDGSTYEYQYSIGDHQGNTRVIFSSITPAPAAPNASFEGDAADKTPEFTNLNATNVVSFASANHTTGGSKVLRMNQTYKLGLAKSVKVFPGDKIDLEVWEYHEGSSGFGTSRTTATILTTLIAQAFGGVSGGAGESGAIFNGVNSAVTGFAPNGNQGDARPAAYLNYILFDVNYKVLDMGWQLAPATTFTKQKVSFPTINIKESGILFTYLSYDDDSNNWVYFDDFKVTHTKGNVIQYNEYYPFGLQTANSWTREGAMGNQFLYNEGSELNQTTSWYDLPFRNYDATLGRFMQVDPLAIKSHSETPYGYASNNPALFNDPTGLLTDAEFWGYYDQLMQSTYGGIWTKDAGISAYGSDEIAFYAGTEAVDDANGWSNTEYTSFEGAAQELFRQTGIQALRTVTHLETMLNPEWLQGRIDASIGSLFKSATGVGGESNDLNWIYGDFDYDPKDANQWLGVSGNVANIVGIATTIATEGPRPIYTGAKNWASQVNSGKSFGNTLGYLGLMLSAYDMYANGVNSSNSLDSFFGVVGFGGPVGASISGAYFVSNLVTIGITGKSIGQHIDDNFNIISTGGLPGVPVLFVPKN